MTILPILSLDTITAGLSAAATEAVHAAVTDRTTGLNREPGAILQYLLEYMDDSVPGPQAPGVLGISLAPGRVWWSQREAARDAFLALTAWMARETMRP